MKKIKLSQEQKELIVKWIEELESGNYSQGRFGLITNSGGFCCLGVAAKACLDISEPLIRNMSDKYDGFLSDKSAERLGLLLAQNTLSILNDGLSQASLLPDYYGYVDVKPHTFEEIAAILRDYYEIPKAA